MVRSSNSIFVGLFLTISDAFFAYVAYHKAWLEGQTGRKSNNQNHNRTVRFSIIYLIAIQLIIRGGANDFDGDLHAKFIALSNPQILVFGRSLSVRPATFPAGKIVIVHAIEKLLRNALTHTLIEVEVAVALKIAYKRCVFS